MKIKVGFGFDVHQLVEGRELWLGGILLEHEKGLLGHSDADVLVHAICDALLGAANMRDIGYHFPDNAGEYKNIDSKILLKKTVELIAAKGYQIGNIVCIDPHHFGKHLLHRRDMGFQFRAFRTDSGVDITDLIAFGSNQLHFFL